MSIKSKKQTWLQKQKDNKTILEIKRLAEKIKSKNSVLAKNAKKSLEQILKNRAKEFQKKTGFNLKGNTMNLDISSKGYTKTDQCRGGGGGRSCQGR